MLKRILYLLLFLSFYSMGAHSQNVLQINAGSRAQWGQNQNLLIDKKGHCTYNNTVINGPVKDSMSFNITKLQLDSIFAKAQQVGFFQLNKKYDGGYADGAGIFIAINSSGRKNSVSLLNIDIPQINELVAMLNRFLQPRKIRIYYGQSPNK